MKQLMLTYNQWLDIVPEIKDLSDELPCEFLMYGQWMRAKIEWKGKVYYATGWNTGSIVIKLQEITEERRPTMIQVTLYNSNELAEKTTSVYKRVTQIHNADGHSITFTDEKFGKVQSNLKYRINFEPVEDPAPKKKAA
jgi:hypothetical protein